MTVLLRFIGLAKPKHDFTSIQGRWDTSTLSSLESIQADQFGGLDDASRQAKLECGNQIMDALCFVSSSINIYVIAIGAWFIKQCAQFGTSMQMRSMPLAKPS